jgi:xylulokinase
MFAGLTLRHTRGELYRAVLESTAYGVRHNVEVMLEIGARPRRVVAVGGGTQSRAWLQIVSDVSGLPQVVPAQTIGAAYGNAFLAGLASRHVAAFEALASEWVQGTGQILPDARRHAEYAEYYSLYRALYEQTKSISHRLAELGAQ